MRLVIKISGLISLVFLFPGWIISQNDGYFLSPLSDEQKNAITNNEIHDNIQPIIQGFDSTVVNVLDSSDSNAKELSIYPIIDFNFGTGLQNSFAYSGIGGLGSKFNYKNRLIIQGKYAFVADKFGEYLNEFEDSLSIIPGVGYLNKTSSANYAHYYTGKSIFNVSNNFSLELGRDKNFWGDGYRSLILSNNSSPYPYFKISTKAWRIKYVNLWAMMRERFHSNTIRHKYIASHALSWNVNKKWNVSLYESVIWQAKDTLNNRGIDINYMNPVIFYRPVEYSTGSADNELVGLSLSYSNKSTKVYAQVLLDEFLLKEIKARSGWWANKYGLQFGIKSFDVFQTKLDIQTEINFVRPFTYSHGSVLQNYGHENQSLAHPLGTNFIEWTTFFHYNFKNIEITEEFLWAIYGRDEHGQNLGGNLYSSYFDIERNYDNYLAQGNKKTLHYNKLDLSYNVPAVKSLKIGLTYVIRYLGNNSENKTENYIFLHVKLNSILRNIDF